MSARGEIGAAIALAIALASGVARADEPAPAPVESRAEALFQEGKRLLEEGRVAEACARLAASEAIDPTVGTLGLLAACHEQEGRIATAAR
ncbi:MAG: hypothetical protein IT372_39360, partial [Polyangiaceae bacterium]|nr:hypothetical protein [Polyangiaceae bacterium]